MNISLKRKIFFSIYVCFVSVIFALFLSFLIAVGTGCNQDEASIMNASSNDNVSVGFFAENAPAASSITLTDAKFLLNNMTLVRNHNYQEGCSIKLGAFVVYLDLSHKVVNTAITHIPAGDYDGIKFEVHKPELSENIPDLEFIAGTHGYSVIAKGYYNGNPFTYRSAVSVGKQIGFVRSVNVNEVRIINVTVSLNPNSWFMYNGVALNPMDEGNRILIERNITNSLRLAFRDIDQDGMAD
jgi:hypothetical protein